MWWIPIVLGLIGYSCVNEDASNPDPNPANPCHGQCTPQPDHQDEMDGLRSEPHDSYSFQSPFLGTSNRFAVDVERAIPRVNHQD